MCNWSTSANTIWTPKFSGWHRHGRGSPTRSCQTLTCVILHDDKRLECCDGGDVPTGSDALGLGPQLVWLPGDVGAVLEEPDGVVDADGGEGVGQRLDPVHLVPVTLANHSLAVPCLNLYRQVKLKFSWRLGLCLLAIRAGLEMGHFGKNSNSRKPKTPWKNSNSSNLQKLQLKVNACQKIQGAFKEFWQFW